MQEHAKILVRRENMIASLLVDTGFKKNMQRFAPYFYKWWEHVTYEKC